jgi:hypothetical protein
MGRFRSQLRSRLAAVTARLADVGLGLDDLGFDEEQMKKILAMQAA